MVDQLLHESLRQQIRLQRGAECLTATPGGHVDRSLRERILDQTKQHQLVTHQISRLDVERDVSLTENLRLRDLDVLGDRIGFRKRHLERWTVWLLPELV